jgi:hypothetical protein
MLLVVYYERRSLSKRKAVTITYTTTAAAAQVLAVLIDARLILGRDFRTEGLYPDIPPVTFMILVVLPTDLLDLLRAISDTAIS